MTGGSPSPHAELLRAEPWSTRWLFAWPVGPFLSIALLVVGARAYLATRGRRLAEPKSIRIEWLFLALTLGMSAWPYPPWAVAEFSLSRLLPHILGPIVAAWFTSWPAEMAICLSGVTAGLLAGPPLRRALVQPAGKSAAREACGEWCALWTPRS